MQSPNLQIDPSSDIPIFRQLIDQITTLIDNGRFAAGEWLPSARAVASSLNINPMTVSKAYQRLAADGRVRREPGLGMIVLPTPMTPSVSQRKRELRTAIEPHLRLAIQSGLDAEQIQQVVAGLLEKRS